MGYPPPRFGSAIVLIAFLIGMTPGLFIDPILVVIEVGVFFILFSIWGHRIPES